MTATSAPPRVPLPPRRLPRSMIRYAPFSWQRLWVQGALAILSALLIGFLLNLLLLSPVQHLVAQQRAGNEFREQLSLGTAPVSEGDFEDVLLADRSPVGLLDIPSIGVSEFIVEGTSSGALKLGPGHRRDTALPGQAGVSVVMGRATAYGGPFSRIQELAPDDTFTVITGQGKQTFEVLGVRYAGDPAPPSPTSGQSRLILETARGMPYAPVGIVRVDAQLVGKAEARGARQTTFLTLGPQEKSLATDLRTAWALVFALQFFLVAEIAAVWSLRRIGAQKTWIVFVPVLLLAGILVADQLTLFLPNLL